MDSTDSDPQRHYRPPDRSARPVARAFGLGFAGLCALFLVGRGVAEFFVIRYNDPASYANSWGGPSLAGVFAVHAGPAVAIVAASALYLIRRRRRGRNRPSRAAC